MSNTADVRRKLTEKDQTMFEEQCEKLKRGWRQEMERSGGCSDRLWILWKTFKKVRKVERELNLKFIDFCVVFGDSRHFWKRNVQMRVVNC